ncbi:rhomboid family intramembrane serine protease [Winogradskyella poriferorum]|uniref:rhomboid family intramembrane serine protease n=1 Tax=Winogradskyella poriferorum TaxID=307627 RepID=UPI003D65248E
MRQGITDAVKHLIIINIIFWIGTLSIGTYGDVFTNLFAEHFPLNDEFRPWQIITHMFMHASYVNTGNGMNIFFLHILFNMLALWMFGTPIEQRLGTKKFLFLYFSAGLGAVLLPLVINFYNFQSILSDLTAAGFESDHILATLNEGKYYQGWVDVIGAERFQDFTRIFNTTSVGASGCVMGLLVGFGMLFPNASLMLIFLPIPIKAKYFIPLLLGYEVISGITGGSSMFGFNVGHFAHIGGALVGFLLMWYWKKNSMDKYRWN